jgi:transposase-like protein
MQFCSWKEHRLVVAALKSVYQAAWAAAARERLEDFDRVPMGPEIPGDRAELAPQLGAVIPFFAFAPESAKSSTPPTRSRASMLRCARR